MDELHGLIDLVAENMACELDHGPIDTDPHPATQLLVQDMGYAETNEIVNKIVIPICKDCIEALTTTEGQKNWVLIYCYNCGGNHWVLRPLAKRMYPPAPIYWVNRCKECCGEPK